MCPPASAHHHHAGGLANSATKTVIALSRGSKIKTYRTWAEFDAFCAASDDPRDTLAQQVTARARSPGFGPARSLDGLRAGLRQWWRSTGKRVIRASRGDDER